MILPHTMIDVGCGSFATGSTGGISITVRQMKTDEEDAT